jgi:signal transduction histidine kinase
MISLRHKLWLGFGGLLVILLLVSLLTAVVLTRHSRALETVFHDNYDSAVYCDGMKAALDQLNLRAQLSIWKSPKAEAIDPTAQEAKFDANLARQFANCTLEGEQEHTQHLWDVWKQYKLDFSQFDSTAADQQSEMYRTILLPQFQEMKQTAQWIVDANMSNMVSVDGQVKQRLVDVRNALLVLVIAGTLAAAAVVGAAGTSIIYPLTNLTRSARQIEAGNLDLNLPVRSRDEIGLLAEAFNSMTARLREFRRIDHERLMRSQQTTQLAIDSLPDGVFIIGSDGKVEISNRTADKLFGVEPGVPAARLGEKLKWLAPLYESAREGHIPEPPPGYQSALQVFDGGEERFLLPRAVPMFGGNNAVIGVTIILVDVTRLRAADEAKSSLVSTVSHELRTPLTSIRMVMNLLGNSKFGQLSAQQTKLLTAAREDGERLYRIIENLMNMSRMESGRAAFVLRPLRPREIVEQAVDAMRGGFIEKNIAIDVQLAEDLPDVMADPAGIGSALTNLLSNAQKYTPASGKVSVGASVDGEFVMFAVADSGPGIPEQFAARVFDKFFRVPTVAGPGGAGLGLSIAKNIVDAHHGRIDFICPKTGGTVFRIYIPISHARVTVAV